MIILHLSLYVVQKFRSSPTCKMMRIILVWPTMLKDNFIFFNLDIFFLYNGVSSFFLQALGNKEGLLRIFAYGGCG